MYERIKRTVIIRETITRVDGPVRHLAPPHQVITIPANASMAEAASLRRLAFSVDAELVDEKPSRYPRHFPKRLG